MLFRSPEKQHDVIGQELQFWWSKATTNRNQIDADEQGIGRFGGEWPLSVLRAHTSSGRGLQHLPRSGLVQRTLLPVIYTSPPPPGLATKADELLGRVDIHRRRKY